MPLYYNGSTKFSPIHVSDIVEIIFQIIESQNKSLTMECIGPKVMSFKEIINELLISIDKKRLLLPLPKPIASLTAKFLQLLPKPLLTEDQLKLLKYDNIKSGLYKTNFDLGLKANKTFRIEVDKYSYNWKTGGQYARKKNIIN